MRSKSLFFLVLIAVLGLLLLPGCGRFRMAPSEPQKKIAFDTYQTALKINASGCESGSPAAQKIVQGSQTALIYTGFPVDPEISDWATTLAEAQASASARPTLDDAIDIAEGGLTFAEGILSALGLGGLAIGGKKITSIVKTLKEKSAALQQVVQANDTFLAQVDTATAQAFKTAQGLTQSAETEKLVALEKVSLPAKIPTATVASTAS